MARALIILSFIFLVVGCTSISEQAQTYKSALRNSEYAHGFAERGEFNQAAELCLNATVLQSQCSISLAQQMMVAKEMVPKNICDAIKPSYQLRISDAALYEVYGTIDENLWLEIREQQNPSKERRLQIQKIKQQCS